MSVRAKKHLGQHFLNDESIAKKIHILEQNHFPKVIEDVILKTDE